MTRDASPLSPTTEQIAPHQATAWWIAVLGFLALAVSFSARATLSLAMPLWAKEGWSLAFASGVGALALTVMALVAPLAGNFLDRHGPRPILVGGLLTLSLGMIIIACSHQGWLLLSGFSLVAAIGFGLVAQHVVATAIAQVTSTRRGLVTGLATSGSTAGQLLLVPALAWLMQDGNWRGGFAALAVAGIVLAVAALLWLKPVARQAKAATHEAGPGLGQRLGTLARQPVFQALFWSFTICGFTTTGAIETHLLPYAAWCGLPPLPSAGAYGLLSGVNLLGMVTVGWLTDRLNRPLLLASIYILRAGCFVLLLATGSSLEILTIFAVAFGLVDYATVPVTASLVASHLGLRVMGLAMGLIAAGHALGGAAGAFWGGWVAEKYHDYSLLWQASLALALLAGVIILLLPGKTNSSHATRGRSSPAEESIP
ncbi:MAG TPA: MFS transporter [Terriglobales bacterium]|nr:MFS transporter [Terriglobales bacterium]